MATGDLPAVGSSSGGRTSRTAPKLERLLTAAAGLMAERGYSQTSIRDVALETSFSLGGMYYYFESKEDLLYQIQEKTFSALLEVQRAAADADGTVESRLRRLVGNHLAYFVDHFNELKVCTFELESLQDERFERIAALRREYYRCLAGVVGELWGVPREQVETHRQVRHATLFIFGMLNWIFMWFDPERDMPADSLGDEMIALVLEGLRAGPQPERTGDS
ncbi:TetR/AcrR family transcriptional regulator [bacterium]|nr:TetR/AcrR family transcriptional regulator [bacterium]